ncbi:hypothetical protein H6F51_12170 [Cyanobacteria bacterium FACHB-DQ100]|uniref:PFE-CTERM domain-containing protein n=1 Tax=Leptolyngbya sp. DQ-M1 TaxID=2933920 RepID=UPI0019C2B583|nr:hypothetical protein [Cyanobacteria bacterium FACHB-DQ100]
MIRNATRLLPLGTVGATIVGMGWAVPSQALDVYGNTLYVPINSDNGSGINTGNPTQLKAVSFRTDNRDWTLNSVALSLREFTSADTAAMQIRTNLPEDPSNPSDTDNPSDTILYTLINPTVPGNGATNNFVFTAPGGSTLLANTTYWLVVTGNSFSWANTINNDLPVAQNGSGWSSSPTATYRFQGTGSPTWSAGDGIRNSFRIDASEITPVPFAFSPIPGLIVSGIIGGVKRARSKSQQAKSTAEA